MALAFTHSVDAARSQALEVREVDSKDVQRQAEGTAELVYVEGSAVEFTLELPAQFGDPISTIGYGKRWRSSEMAQYVVDKARIRSVLLERLKESKRKERVTVTVELTTEWFSQDVDLVVELKDRVSARTYYEKAWDDVTIGGSGAAGVVWGAGGPQSPTARWDLKDDDAKELRELLSSGNAVLRVAMAIDDE
jgi:hypothetical protein